MDRRPFFSVIMPVRNAEATLARAVESILSQDFRDCELILAVNDSSDASLSIARRFAGKNDSVRVCDTPVPGASNARNLGLDMARGEYAVFCDADDLYLPGALRAMADSLMESPCDVLAGFSKGCSLQNSGQTYPVNARELYMALMDAPAHIALAHPALAGKRLLLISPCAKAYRMDFLNGKGLRFDPRYAMLEDFAFNRDVFRAMSSARAVDRELYLYAVHDGSLSKRSDLAFMRERIQALDLIRSDSPAGSPEEQSALRYLLFRLMLPMVHACAVSQNAACLDCLAAYLRRPEVHAALSDMRSDNLDAHGGIGMVLSLTLRALRAGDAAEAAHLYQVLAVRPEQILSL